MAITVSTASAVTRGSIYDFAARLWGQDTKGRAFIELRERLLWRYWRWLFGGLGG